MEALILSKNQLTVLPSEIGRLNELKILDVFDNQLTELHPEIKNRANLDLKILNNPLSEPS